MIKEILGNTLLGLVIFILILQGFGIFIGSISGSLYPESDGGWDCKPTRYIHYVAYSSVLACELVKERDWE